MCEQDLFKNACKTFVVIAYKKWYCYSFCILFDSTGEDRGPVLEVIVSRTNFISSHTSKSVRVVGLSTALANARDLADWLGIGQVTNPHNTQPASISSTQLSRTYPSNVTSLSTTFGERLAISKSLLEAIHILLYIGKLIFSGSVLLPLLGFDMICILFTAIQIEQEILAPECCIFLVGCNWWVLFRCNHASLTPIMIRDEVKRVE